MDFCSIFLHIWSESLCFAIFASKIQVIDGKLAAFLQQPFLLNPLFYILPKINTNLEQPPGRPIVSCVDYILSPIAIFVDKIIRP